MSVVGLTVELVVTDARGEQAVQKITTAFERAGDEIKDFGKHVFPRLVSVFEAAEGRQFDAEGGGPFAGHWAALSKRYAEWKSKAYPGKKTLERTGDLREALTSSTSPLAARDYSASSMAFGTAGVEYASFHVTGTPFMPARAPFDFDATFEDELEKATHLGIVDALRAARLDEVADVTV